MPYDRGCYMDVAPFWGDTLWAFLNETPVLIVMLKAVREGAVPVEAIDNELTQRFGKAVRQERVHEFTGHLVRQAIEAYLARTGGQNAAVPCCAETAAQPERGDYHVQGKDTAR
jgi:hypothetical protein